METHRSGASFVELNAVISPLLLYFLTLHCTDTLWAMDTLGAGGHLSNATCIVLQESIGHKNNCFKVTLPVSTKNSMTHFLLKSKYAIALTALLHHH
jgi:hypothetical protein